MTIEFVASRRGEVLFPAWPQDEATFELLPERQLVTVEVRKTANPRRKAWYRALLARLIDYTGAWPDPQEAHKQLLVRCGFAESVLVTDWGDMRFTPPPTRDWDDLKWSSYLAVLIPFLCSEHLTQAQALTIFDELEAASGVNGREFVA